MTGRNWQKDIQPLVKKYKGKKFPLDHGNTYELVVMVIQPTSAIMHLCKALEI